MSLFIMEWITVALRVPRLRDGCVEPVHHVQVDRGSSTRELTDLRSFTALRPSCWVRGMLISDGGEQFFDVSAVEPIELPNKRGGA